MRLVFALLITAALVSPFVIYRRNQKRKLICKAEGEWQQSTSSEEDSSEEARTRVRRDIEVDPELKSPIIYLGTSSNSSVFIDDGDFDIVSDYLSPEELEQVKRQIMNTCNALNAN